MRFLSVWIAFCMCAVSAQATVDPDADQIGFYFDLTADEVCLDVSVPGTYSAYLVITNPTSEVYGIAIQVCEVGDLMGLGRSWYGTTIGMDYWTDSCYCAQFGFMEPPPSVGSNVPLVKFDYFLLPDTTGEIYLRQLYDEVNEDGLPAYLGADDIEYPLGISSGDPDLPAAFVNGECNIVSSAEFSLDAVKSLYR